MIAAGEIHPDGSLSHDRFCRHRIWHCGTRTHLYPRSHHSFRHGRRGRAHHMRRCHRSLELLGSQTGGSDLLHRRRREQVSHASSNEEHGQDAQHGTKMCHGLQADQVLGTLPRPAVVAISRVVMVPRGGAASEPAAVARRRGAPVPLVHIQWLSGK